MFWNGKYSFSEANKFSIRILFSHTYLFSFGVQKLDVFRGINDNTASAVKAGELIASGRRADGSTISWCGMHTSELVVKHALGLVERRRANRVVDSFPDSKSLIKRAKKVCTHIMDKGCKKRFVEYNKYCLQMFNCKALKLQVPNKTRVSGTHITFQLMLRMKPVIMMIQNSAPWAEKIRDLLSREDWRLIAEFDAILNHITFLSMEYQREIEGWVALTWFLNQAARRKLFGRNATFKVTDTSKVWDPTTTKENIPRIEHTVEQLHVTSQLFLKRLDHEFTFYYPEPDGDQIVAMQLHPATARLGLK